MFINDNSNRIPDYKFPMKNKKWIDTIIIVSIIISIVTFIDLFSRSHLLSDELRIRDWIIYAFSLIIETLLFYALFVITSFLPKYLYWFVITIFAIFYSFVVIGALNFFKFFHNLPGIYTFNFILGNIDEAFALSETNFNLHIIFTMLLLVVVILTGAYFNQKGKFSKKCLLVSILVFIFALINFVPISSNQGTVQTSFPTIGAMVLSRENRSLPFNHTIICFSKSLINQYLGKLTNTGMQKRSVTTKPKIKRFADRSAVLIISESVRRNNVSLYGYSRKTTPEIENIEKLYPNAFIKFSNSFSNATHTSISISFLLAGLSPAVGLDKLQNSYLVHEIVETLNNIKIAYITSWKYKSNTYADFVYSEAIDYFYCQETEKLPVVVDIATDDAIIPIQFNNFLKKLPANEHFFTILHFGDTHYPYYSPDPKKWDENDLVDTYDNSIYYQDNLIGQVFKILKEYKRLDETLVIYTSDHGEGLGVHRPIGHGHLKDIYTVGVPIWAYIPNQELYRKAIKLKDKNISNSDIAPTILTYFGFDPKEIGTTHNGLFDEKAEREPIYIYDWRQGFEQGGHDYLGFVLGDSLLNVVRQHNILNYQVAKLNETDTDTLNTSISLKTIQNEFNQSVRKYNKLNHFFQK